MRAARPGEGLLDRPGRISHRTDADVALSRRGDLKGSPPSSRATPAPGAPVFRR
ncbi:hypothetical protein [Streptomyces sp. NBC_00448]|uniref:hypothetical protein n=1 Tax=Streptomyces sp. NBC_00448 TaxID=2903652 RepID=UPI002E24BA92